MLRIKMGNCAIAHMIKIKMGKSRIRIGNMRIVLKMGNYLPILPICAFSLFTYHAHLNDRMKDPSLI